eukprot:2791041-Prymnesium_polylepis.1
MRPGIACASGSAVRHELLKLATRIVRSPATTASAACVTVPVKTSAVPAAAWTMSVGGTLGAWLDAMWPPLAQRREPGSSVDQKAVPPPSKAPLAASESGTSTVRAILSSCGLKQPPTR